MPIFELVMQEKPPVVLEIGTAYSKLGFATEAYPRFIIPSEVYVSATGKIDKLFNYKCESDLYDWIVDFLHEIFFKHVLVSPKERKIVIVESVFCETVIRENLARALFRHFEVASIYFVPTHLVSLATLGIDTALVVDLGYKETTVIPVYSGVQFIKAFQAQPYGGQAVHKAIELKLLEIGVKEEFLTERVLEDIKARACFVTTSERARTFRGSDGSLQPCPDVEYPVNGREMIKIPGILRENAFEVFFPEDNERQSLPYLILDAIMACPVDMRVSLAENIFLIGGSSMVRGLTARLMAELLQLLDSDFYKSRMFIKTFKFHKASSKQNFTAWLGGSIYGGTDLVVTKSFAREAYSKCQRVPDWVNLDDNKPHIKQ